VKKLPRTISNIEDAKQLVRSSGSIGANYIEANEAISKKDQIYRMKICRKETKETVFWLNNIEISINESYRDEWSVLINEAKELFLIFCAIVRKSS
jgi:four helix bundle protein|tara:strand:+ start:3193 stop:3480 length:288 start_codon:yes stop_codon:yes gene_type:complete